MGRAEAGSWGLRVQGAGLSSAPALRRAPRGARALAPDLGASAHSGNSRSASVIARVSCAMLRAGGQARETGFDTRVCRAGRDAEERGEAGDGRRHEPVGVVLEQARPRAGGDALGQERRPRRALLQPLENHGRVVEDEVALHERRHLAAGVRVEQLLGLAHDGRARDGQALLVGPEALLGERDPHLGGVGAQGMRVELHVDPPLVGRLDRWRRDRFTQPRHAVAWRAARGARGG